MNFSPSYLATASLLLALITTAAIPTAHAAKESERLVGACIVQENGIPRGQTLKFHLDATDRTFAHFQHVYGQSPESFSITLRRVPGTPGVSPPSLEADFVTYDAPSGFSAPPIGKSETFRKLTHETPISFADERFSTQVLCEATLISQPTYNITDTDPVPLAELTKPRASLRLDVPGLVDCGVRVHLPRDNRNPDLNRIRYVAEVASLMSPNAFALEFDDENDAIIYRPIRRDWSDQYIFETPNRRTSLAEMFRIIFYPKLKAAPGSIEVFRCPEH